MAHNTGMMGNQRDFGLTGPGKGDKDRTSSRKKFNENFKDVIFPNDTKGFVKGKGARLVKKYS